MLHVVFVALIVPWVLGSAIPAGQDEPAGVSLIAAKTGKERLSDKASDEQRVDDCKVPKERRTRSRPTDCPWHLGS